MPMIPRMILQMTASGREGVRWFIMEEEKKALLIENTARNIAPVTENTKYRHAVHCFWADAEYGEWITEAMHLDLDKVKELAKGNHDRLIQATFKVMETSHMKNS